MAGVLSCSPRRFQLFASPTDVFLALERLPEHPSSVARLGLFARFWVSHDTDSDDLDEGREQRTGCHSVFRGPEPVFQGFATSDQQFDALATVVRQLLDQGRALDEIAVFTRTNRLLELGQAALRARGIAAQPVHDTRESREPALWIGSMQRAKGLEFKVVFVVDVSAGVLPHPQAVRAAEDDIARREAEAAERRLLYVSMTRARDELFVYWVRSPSLFLQAS